MEQIIGITNFIKNYSHYFQKVSISLILAKSKKHSGWFCIFMKILYEKERKTMIQIHIF